MLLKMNELFYLGSECECNRLPPHPEGAAWPDAAPITICLRTGARRGESRDYSTALGRNQKQILRYAALRSE